MSTESEASPAPEHPQWATQAFERLADLVVVVDPTGTIVWANPFGCDLLGVGLDEATGTNLADYLHPDDLVRALRVMTLMVDREIDGAVTPAVYRVRRSDGSWCPIELNGSMPRAGACRWSPTAGRAATPT